MIIILLILIIIMSSSIAASFGVNTYTDETALVIAKVESAKYGSTATMALFVMIFVVVGLMFSRGWFSHINRSLSGLEFKRKEHWY